MTIIDSIKLSNHSSSVTSIDTNPEILKIKPSFDTVTSLIPKNARNLFLIFSKANHKIQIHLKMDTFALTLIAKKVSKVILV